jgi:hypothetical protein
VERSRRRDRVTGDELHKIYRVMCAQCEDEYFEEAIDCLHQLALAIGLDGDVWEGGDLLGMAFTEGWSDMIFRHFQQRLAIGAVPPGAAEKLAGQLSQIGRFTLQALDEGRVSPLKRAVVDSKAMDLQNMGFGLHMHLKQHGLSED